MEKYDGNAESVDTALGMIGSPLGTLLIFAIFLSLH